MSHRRFRILISIDCIFDTLYGAVKSVNPDWIENLSENGYHTRNHNYLTDIDPAIDMVKVREVYADRDLLVLRNSMMTQLPVWLAANIRRFDGSDEQHPEYMEMSISINTWPYKLPVLWKSEMKKYLTGILGLKNEDKLTFCSVALKDLHPLYIQGRYEAFMLPSLDEWVNIHVHNLAKHPIQDVTCTIPLILYDDKRKEGSNQLAEISEALRKSFSVALHLDIVELGLMSFIKPVYESDPEEVSTHE